MQANTRPEGTKAETMERENLAEWEYELLYGEPEPPLPGVAEIHEAYEAGLDRQVRSGAGRWEHSMLCSARDEALRYDNPAALAEAVATGDILPKDDECWTESGWCIRARRRIRAEAERLGLVLRSD
ncbi:hypothetical protein [Nocardiopsis alba]|uniref:hypothetical protein n=1 Tax=Nocardiopsis alba TaxID=53437 RepID=UPI003D752E62